MCAASLSNVGDEIALPNKLDVKQMCESSELKYFIPTAIVKPKYQKLSFDERQLPLCGATITETPRRIQKHLPSSNKSLPRRTGNLMKNCGTVVIGEKRNGLLANMNSVAIVQPLENKTALSQPTMMSSENNYETVTNFEESSVNISIGHDMRKSDSQTKTTKNRISGEF